MKKYIAILSLIFPLSLLAQIHQSFPEGKISSQNSTTTTLNTNETWTGGTEDVAKYSSISVSWNADVSSAANGVKLQFSTDGLNWDRQIPVTSSSDLLQQNFGGVHRLSVIARYFRVIFENGSSSQTFFRLQTMLHINNTMPLVSRASQAIDDDSDVSLVRNVSEVLLDEALSRNADRKQVAKFGANPNVNLASAPEDIWDEGGLYTGFLTNAQNIQVRSGGNAADNTSSTNARTIVIEGLNSLWAEASETLSLSGTAKSASTTGTFFRVFRAYVQDVGTYGEANAGDITIETLSSNVVAKILTGQGQTEMAVYTVPKGFTGYVRKLSASVDGSKPADILFFARQGADDVTVPYRSKRVFHKYTDLTGFAVERFTSYKGPFMGPCDVWAEADVANNGTAVGADFDLILIRD